MPSETVTSTSVKLLEELYSLAVVVTGKTDITVQRDDNADTAYTDLKNIVVTLKLVPEKLRAFPLTVDRLFNAMTLHEAGHILKTAPMDYVIKQFFSGKDMNIAKFIENCSEDVRVNHYIRSRFRFDDFSACLDKLCSVTGRSWHDRTLGEVQKGKLKAGEVMLSIMGIEGLYGVPCDDIWAVIAAKSKKDWTIEGKADMETLKGMMGRYKNALTGKSVQSTLEAMYSLMVKWFPLGNNPDMGQIPIQLGGTLVLEGDAQSIKEAKEEADAKAKAEGEDPKDPTDAEDKADGEGDEGDGEDGKGHGTGYGRGDGANIPAPDPNPGEYRRLEAHCRAAINKLLNLLKQIARPRMVPARRQRSGRMMPSEVTRSYVGSFRGSVEDVYMRQTYQVEKSKTTLGILVDLSGSTDEEEARRVLTVIAEVAGRWLRDEDFAFMVFGSDYAKVKTFREAYNNTKERIGGVTCMGGTELNSPLREFHKLFRDAPANDRRVMIIASDFAVPDEDECKKTVDAMARDGIETVGLIIPGCKEPETAEVICGKAVADIEDMEDLPDKFFDIYRGKAL